MYHDLYYVYTQKHNFKLHKGITDKTRSRNLIIYN